MPRNPPKPDRAARHAALRTARAAVHAARDAGAFDDMGREEARARVLEMLGAFDVRLRVRVSDCDQWVPDGVEYDPGMLIPRPDGTVLRVGEKTRQKMKIVRRPSIKIQLPK